MKRSRKFAILAFVSILLAGLAIATGAAQQPAASLQGIVVEAGSTVPVSRATVELTRIGVPGSEVTRTDSEGRFFLPNTSPGQYRLVVSHSGHVKAEYGQLRPGSPGNPLVLTAGQHVDNVRIEMTRGGSISGHITDNGRPVGLSDAVVFRGVFIEGQLSLSLVSAGRADDTGEYHLFWLPPGRYYLAAIIWETASAAGWTINPEGVDTAFFAQRQVSRNIFMRTTAGGVSETEAHIPVFYGGSSDPLLATVIDVQPGSDFRGMDIEAGPLPTRHVKGTVVGIPAAIPGQPPIRVSVNMRSLMGTLNTNSAQSPNANAETNGVFDITRVVPGRYVLNASAGNLSGRTVVEVRDRDLTNISVSLMPGFTVTGRVIIERTGATGPDPALSSLRIGLRTDPLIPGATNYTAIVQPDGSFAIPSSVPNAAAASAGPIAGDYRVLVNPILTPPTAPEASVQALPPQLQSLYVKSIRMGDVDVLNDPLRLTSQPSDQLVIVIGTNPGSLSGKAVPGSTVVLIHDSPLRYRVNEKTAIADPAGNFAFANVPPGNYKAFAWEFVERGAWGDVNFMRSQEERGVPVHVDEGKSSTIDSKLN